MARLFALVLALVALITTASAQFGGNFFEQMFQAHGQQQNQPRENAPSDSNHYQAEFDSVYCDKYLCPGTLACVHFPHHCPCAWPGVEDKVELGEGIAICASKGGYKDGEMQRKVELARKGLL